MEAEVEAVDGQLEEAEANEKFTAVASLLQTLYSDYKLQYPAEVLFFKKYTIWELSLYYIYQSTYFDTIQGLKSWGFAKNHFLYIHFMFSNNWLSNRT